MYEDNSVEERYLYNFSPDERRTFYHTQQKIQKHMIIYRQKLMQLLDSNSPAIFANYEPRPNSILQIKYVLNRIAANDRRDTAFEVSAMDQIPNPDRLALDIAKAFYANTLCQTVVLHSIGLTDNGMIPILHALSSKKLSLLNIMGNKITEKSFQTLNNILEDPKTKWDHVQLGQIHVTKDLENSLKAHPNVSFKTYSPSLERLKYRFSSKHTNHSAE